MKQFVRKYKTSLIIGGVLLAALLAYYFWSQNQVSDSVGELTFTESSSASAAASTLAGREILSALGDLRALRLDDSIFASAVFKSLVDYTIATTSEPLGRPDPFAPLPLEEENNE